MSSETITRNDLTAILNEVLPPTPSEYKKLLWTNPDPTSNITNQTIMASGADAYDEIEVIYKTTSYYNGYLTARAPFIAGGHITLDVPGGVSGEFSGAPYNCLRTISMASGGGLSIDSGVGSYSQGSEANNGVCIPYKIYGIKYERVAPPQLDASDYVVEQGTSDIWTYRKWNSGIAECWGIKTGSVAITTAYGNIYVSAEQPRIDYPFTFTSVSIANVVPGTTSMWVLASQSSTTTQTPTYYLARANTNTQSVSVNFHIIGTWK